MRYAALFLLIASSAFAADGSSNYVTGTAVITPGAGSMPALGSSYTDTTTGATITRRSNITSMGSATDGMIVYSRFSPTNSNGQYLIVHGTNSTSAYVWRLSDNTMMTDLRLDGDTQIGEVNEIRWDYSGSYPNRIYFVGSCSGGAGVGMCFYYMDAISGNESPTLIRNFTSDWPTADHIFNDVEGDSSADSRYWAWQVRGPYSGGIFPVIGIFTYDKTTNSILGRLEPGDVTPTQNPGSWAASIPRPNMVEISPCGTRVITHHTRSYTGSTTADWDGTYYDSPHAWALDFSGTPVQVSNDETHSGWGWVGTKAVFVSQQNSTDKLQACYIDGTGGAWPSNCFNFADHTGMEWVGIHFARMPSSRPGWVLASTYSTTSNNWAENQLLMFELLPEAESPRVWRVAPEYNQYAGDYRDEGSAAMSQDGDKIYWTGNWNNASSGHGEALEIDLPDGWWAYFGGVTPTTRRAIGGGTIAGSIH